MAQNTDAKRNVQSNNKHILREQFKARKELQKVAAEGRRLERNLRSPEEQVKVLNERLGFGVGAWKERLRLDLAIFNSMDPTEQKVLSPWKKSLDDAIVIISRELLAIRCLRKFGLTERPY